MYLSSYHKLEERIQKEKIFYKMLEDTMLYLPDQEYILTAEFTLSKTMPGIYSDARKMFTKFAHSVLVLKIQKIGSISENSKEQRSIFESHKN